MSNIFTYLEEVQHDSIYDKPFNELDLLILTEMTYLPFDQLVHEDMSPYCDCRLLDLA
ncbi:MAG: alpha/beta hydrolase, partial [Streptococcus sp.]